MVVEEELDEDGDVEMSDGLVKSATPRKEKKVKTPKSKKKSSSDAPMSTPVPGTAGKTTKSGKKKANTTPGRRVSFGKIYAKGMRTCRCWWVECFV